MDHALDVVTRLIADGICVLACGLTGNGFYCSIIPCFTRKGREASLSLMIVRQLVAMVRMIFSDEKGMLKNLKLRNI
jgi:hypothetical protein